MEQYWLLIDGCAKHPSFRARRPPLNGCPTCLHLYQVRIRLQLNESPPPPFDPRCLFCADAVVHTPEQHYRSMTAATRPNENSTKN
jgi:hypothetical protein